MRLLIINISSSFPAINIAAYYQRQVSQLAGRWSGGVGSVDNTRPVAALTADTEARYRLRIAITAHPTCIRRPRYGGSRRNIAMPYGVEKREWCVYPKVKKFRRYVYSF